MNSRKWLILANLYSFSANYGFKMISQYELLLNMEVPNELEYLLPDQLERIKQVIDKLLKSKMNNRLTNQEYQKNSIDIKCPKCREKKYKKNGHKNGTQRYLCKICHKSFSITTNTLLSYSKINYLLL